MIFSWIDNKNIHTGDFLEFRELAFDIVKELDFPKTEVDYFLSRFLTNDITNEVKKYLAIKREQIKTGIPFEDIDWI